MGNGGMETESAGMGRAIAVPHDMYAGTLMMPPPNGEHFAPPPIQFDEHGNPMYPYYVLPYHPGYRFPGYAPPAQMPMVPPQRAMPMGQPKRSKKKKKANGSMTTATPRGSMMNGDTSANSMMNGGPMNVKT